MSIDEPAPTAPTGSASIDSLRVRLAAAAAGVLHMSEGEAPFIALAVDAAGSGDPTAADIRRHFAIPAGVPVAERSLDEFFRPLVEDVDPADAVAQRTVPRARALREAIRLAAPGARAFRVGDGAEVRYLVVGRAASPRGAIVGVETIGYES